MLSSLYIELALVCCTNTDNVHCFGIIFPNVNFVYASICAARPVHIQSDQYRSCSTVNNVTRWCTKHDQLIMGTWPIYKKNTSYNWSKQKNFHLIKYLLTTFIFFLSFQSVLVIVTFGICPSVMFRFCKSTWLTLWIKFIFDKYESR